MVRTIIKGGVWKNTEDEVLKAAIAKYGKNQWARISSLLVRKTPKQCKARWYEWLDPSIKKTEWAKEEDEKLLHLAKLMPTQWRTIAPIVGRTATQCLERYQKLLDEAEAKENEELGLAGPSDDTGAPTADEVRRLRPGEIDPDPETKPARPDPIDMDEDEKEMLSEARARLANTQGKKAKRKARERQLEEARRLAVLQKKRELKAAGIIMRSKTKKRGMDYNADIPFEKKPAAGFYDTTEEQLRVTSAPIGQSLRRLENKRKPDMEEEERRKRQKRNDASAAKETGHQTKFIPSREAQIQKLKEAESIGRRRKLVLPTAQVGEAELEEIVKIGQAGESVKALVNSGAGGGESGEASGRLLSDYEGVVLEGARMARTPRTLPQHDSVMMEARNLRNMTVAQTPLLGDENTPLHVAPPTSSGGGTGFEGATPRHQVAFTPNPLASATPLRRQDITDGSQTPAMVASATPLCTPLRDNLSINPEDYPVGSGEGITAKRALKTAFMNLPKPENNFELIVPDDEQEEGGNEVREGGDMEGVEDAATRDARLKKLKEEEERKELARRSQVIRRGLPRLPNVDVEEILERLNLAEEQDEGEEDGEMVAAQQLVNAELVGLMEHDSIKFPLPGTTLPGSSVSTYVLPDDEALDLARDEIHRELGRTLGFPDASPGQLDEALRKLAKAESGAAVRYRDLSWYSIRTTSMMYDPAKKRWVEDPLEGIRGLTDEEKERKRKEGYQVLLNDQKETMTREAAKTSKLERKLGVILAGYQTRSQTLCSRITTAFEQLQKSKLEYESFSKLADVERAVIGPKRVMRLEEEVERLEGRERVGQGRYKELVEEREDAKGRLQREEEKVMEEAERVLEERMMQEEEEAVV